MGLFKWARSHSFLALPFVGTVCCQRMAQWLDPGFAASVGDPPGTWTPQHADLLVVVGKISHKQAPVLLRLREQMPEPARVLHIIGCHRGHGDQPTYASVTALDQVLPVLATVAGCPANEAALNDAIASLARHLRGEEGP